MKINQYEFLRDGKPFEPTREEIVQFAEHELQEKDKKIKDLQRQLAEKESERELDNSFWKQECDSLQKALAEMTEKYNACQEARKLEAEFNSQDKKELKQQLAEKDEEIKIWKDFTEAYKLQCHKFLENEEFISKTTRHQVCEEIRNGDCDDFEKYEGPYYRIYEGFLKKVEKGE